MRFFSFFPAGWVKTCFFLGAVNKHVPSFRSSFHHRKKKQQNKLNPTLMDLTLLDGNPWCSIEKWYMSMHLKNCPFFIDHWEKGPFQITLKYSFHLNPEILFPRHEASKCCLMIIYLCHGQKSLYILGMGRPPTFNRNPYNGYINPYYWVDDHPLVYGKNGSLDPGTFDTDRCIDPEPWSSTSWVAFHKNHRPNQKHSTVVEDK